MNFVDPRSAVTGGVLDAPADLLKPRRVNRKWPISYRSVTSLAITCDFAGILICSIVCGTLYNLEVFGWSGDIIDHVGSAVVVATLFIALMKSRQLYNPAELVSLRTQVLGLTATWLGVFLLLSGTVFALKIGDHFSRGAIFLFGTCGLVLLIVQRVIYRSFLIRGLNGERFAGRSAVVVTDDAPAMSGALIYALLKHGFQLDRHFILPAEQDQRRQEDFLTEIVGYLRGSDVEEIILGVGASRWGDLSSLLSGLRILPLPVSLVPIGEASNILSRPARIMGDSVCIELQRGPLGRLERGIKRAVDVLAALVGLAFLAPLLAITAVLIKWDSTGPILFRQQRCGFNGRPFHIFKFRTMTVQEDGAAVRQAEQSDARVTRIGKWLRRTSIDELPQLLNVLNGSMSLVGPRPHAQAHDNHFDRVVSNYAFRQHVKPGVTGWAQINGHRGPTPTVAHIRRRVEFDLWYIDNWSFRLDCLIIVRTVLEIMRGRNAY